MIENKSYCLKNSRIVPSFTTFPNRKRNKTKHSSVEIPLSKTYQNSDAPAPNRFDTMSSQALEICIDMISVSSLQWIEVRLQKIVSPSERSP